MFNYDAFQVPRAHFGVWVVFKFTRLSWYTWFMKRQDVMSILFTALIGFVGGGYLYVTHFSKLIQPDTVQTVSQAEAFTIIGEAYGSCGVDCPSFQILNDGSYRYQYAQSAGSQKSIKSGTVPLQIQGSVKAALNTETLIVQSKALSAPNCDQSSINYRYKVTYDGAEYLLDSCTTALNGTGDVWNSLVETWNYFETIKE